MSHGKFSHFARYEQQFFFKYGPFDTSIQPLSAGIGVLHCRYCFFDNTIDLIGCKDVALLISTILLTISRVDESHKGMASESGSVVGGLWLREDSSSNEVEKRGNVACINNGDEVTLNGSEFWVSPETQGPIDTLCVAIEPL